MVLLTTLTLTQQTTMKAKTPKQMSLAVATLTSRTKGRMIRRASWKPGEFIEVTDDGRYLTRGYLDYKVTSEDVRTNDWQIAFQPMTGEQAFAAMMKGAHVRKISWKQFDPIHLENGVLLRPFAPSWSCGCFDEIPYVRPVVTNKRKEWVVDPRYTDHPERFEIA